MHLTPAAVKTPAVGETREATAADAEAVRGVWEAVAAEGQWIGAELPLRLDWSDRFRSGCADPDAAWFVAEVERVVGAVHVRDEGGRAHVGMAIVDGHRGRGLGRLLLSSAVDWARAHGSHKVVLELWPHNERARALYRSAGFTEEGHFSRQYRRKSGELWDAVAMGLVLDSTSPGRS